MLFAAPWLLWVATRKDGFRLGAALGAGYLPLSLFLGLGWFLMSGNLQRNGLAVAAVPIPASDRLWSMLKIFTLPDATTLLARLVGISKIWLWAVPGIMILAVVGAIRWRHNVLCRLLSASALLTLGGYFIVPVDQGHGWGYRYFHSAWMTMPLLATAALFRPAPRATLLSSAVRLYEDGATRNFVAACILLTLGLGIGFRAWQIQVFLALDLNQLPHYVGKENRVVILDTRSSFYGADLVQNDPWLRGSEIRLYSHGTTADGHIMAKYYPNFHKVYADRYGAVWSEAPVTSMMK